MTIKQKEYKKPKSKSGHGAVMSNVRLKWTGLGRKTAKDAREAFREMLRTQAVPKGWKVAVVQWGHPQPGESLDAARARLKATGGWMEGDVSELWEMFSGLFAHYEAKLQVGVVRGDDD